VQDVAAGNSARFHPQGVNRDAGCFGFHDRMVVIFGFGPGSPEDQGEVAPYVCPCRPAAARTHDVDQGVLSDAAYAAAKRRILTRAEQPQPPGPPSSPPAQPPAS